MPRDVLSAAQPHTEKPQQPLQDIFSLQFFLFLSHPYFPLSLLIYSSSSSAFHPRDKKKKIIYKYVLSKDSKRSESTKEETPLLFTSAYFSYSSTQHSPKLICSQFQHSSSTNKLEDGCAISCKNFVTCTQSNNLIKFRDKFFLTISQSGSFYYF